MKSETDTASGLANKPRPPPILRPIDFSITPKLAKSSSSPRQPPSPLPVTPTPVIGVPPHTPLSTDQNGTIHMDDTTSSCSRSSSSSTSSPVPALDGDITHRIPHKHRHSKQPYHRNHSSRSSSHQSMESEDDVVAQQAATAAAAAALVVYRGCGSQQLIPIEQSLMSPPPPPLRKFEWNKHLRHLSDEYIDDAFGRMEYHGRSDIGSTVSPDHFKIDGFIGLEALTTKFCKTVIQRIKPSDVYASAFKDSRSYHFAVVGRPGFGKRTAILKACALTNRDVVVITKEKYQPEDLALVSEFASVKQPFVIYIDDFDALCQNEVFLKEYKTLCTSPFVTERVFLNVWIIISVINDQDALISPLLRRVCPDVNRVKIPEIPPDVLDQVLWDDLRTSKIKIDPPMIDTDWTKFYNAIIGASPKDVKEFGLSITTLAMEKMSYDDIMKRSAASKTMEQHSRQLIMCGGIPPQPPPLTHQEQPDQHGPTQGDISLASAGLLLAQTSDQPRFMQQAATHQFEENFIMNGVISWEEVEQLYTLQPASQTTDKISKAIIPRIS